MFEGSDKTKLSPAEHGDPRVTRVGKWLRRTRIDELPQLFNIVKGDMAFVGPRPFVPEQEEDCAAQIPFYRERWLVKPGATGWAQINRGYNATLEDNKEKLAYDLFYIKNVSLGLDLFIMFSTSQDPAVGQRRAIGAGCGILIRCRSNATTICSVDDKDLELRLYRNPGGNEFNEDRAHHRSFRSGRQLSCRIST